MDELNQENIKIAIKSDSHKEALENLTINKDILKVLTSDQDFDTAIIVSCEK
jgi:transcription antitermination factor NusA-like protein